MRHAEVLPSWVPSIVQLWFYYKTETAGKVQIYDILESYQVLWAGLLLGSWTCRPGVYDSLILIFKTRIIGFLWDFLTWKGWLKLLKKKKSGSLGMENTAWSWAVPAACGHFSVRCWCCFVHSIYTAFFWSWLKAEVATGMKAQA